jgi:hypothetical protein
MAGTDTIGRQREDWTKDEIKTLKQVFRGNATAEVAKMLQRTPKSVERKAARLGLKKTKKYLRTLGRV